MVPETATQSNRVIIKFFENFNTTNVHENIKLSGEMLYCEFGTNLPHAKKTTLSLHIYRCVLK